MTEKTPSAASAETDSGALDGAVEEKAGRPPSYTIQTLVLGLEVLEAMIRSGQERRISDLAKELGTTKWRIFRYLHTLCEAGYLKQNADTDRFSIGRRTYSLFEALPQRFGFLDTAREEMRRLRELRGHTVVAASLIDDERIMILDAMVSTQIVQFMLRIGSTFDLYSSAHGKVALAFGDPKLLERTLSRPLERHTEYTITSPDALRREIETIRNRGWAMSAEEVARGINTIAAPIISSRGYEGSISLFGSIETLRREPDPDDLSVLLASAERISQLMN